MVSVLVGEGQLIPMGYAIAYRDFDLDMKVAYPIPLHFLVRWFRDFRFWLMSVGRPGYRENIESAAYRRGVECEIEVHRRLEQDYYNRGFETGVREERGRALREFDAYVAQRSKEREDHR